VTGRRREPCGRVGVGWAGAVAIGSWLVASAAAAQIVVPDDFATIQAAIDAADPGQTIIVLPGTYTENITLRSDIALRGDEAARTFLQPAQVRPTVSIVGASDVLFANFTLPDAAIGVLVEDGTDITIANTIFASADDAAIDTDAISTVDVVNNAFWSNAIAIRRASVDTQITNNVFAENTATVRQPTLGDPAINIEFNCFFANDDLRQGPIDTGLGSNFQIGDPLFVDTSSRDFHLRQSSQCIDAGTGLDVIDDTVADIGAYGGTFADVRPFPVPQPAAQDASANPPPPYDIRLTWAPNLAYLVTNSVSPGGYRVHYRLNASGPPYDGTDAGAGTQPSPIDVGNVTTYTLTDLTPQVSAPAPPNLSSAAPRNQAIVLTWSDVPEAIGYRVFYGAVAVDENEIAVGDVTSFTVLGLENGRTYRFAIAAVTAPKYFFAVTVLDNTQARHESAFSVEQSLTIGPVSVSALSNELAATPEVTVPVPDLPDEGCFIATAAYSSESAPEVLALRDFRDRYLEAHAAGRAFVRVYYALSPRLARYLDAHAGAKPVVRAALLPIVAVALFLLESGFAAKVAVVLLLCTGAVATLRRRAGRARGAGAR
jgi:hypothetical protein